jgi:hypothetical protein
MANMGRKNAMLGTLLITAGIASITVSVMPLQFPAKRVSVPVLAYMVLLACQAAVMGLMFLRGAEAYGSAYFEFYRLSNFLVMLAEICVAGSYAIEGTIVDGAALLACLVFAGTMVLATALKFHAQLPDSARWVLLTTAIEFGCALSVLFSVSLSSGDVETILKCGIGAYWLTDSLYWFAFAFGRLNPHLSRITRYDWISTAIALVFMLLLIVKLSGGQAELTRQHTVEFQQVERSVQEG